MRNASRTQAVNGKTQKKKYPHLGFRPQAGLQKRINQISAKSGLNQSQIINACLANHLPILERKSATVANALGKKA